MSLHVPDYYGNPPDEPPALQCAHCRIEQDDFTDFCAAGRCLRCCYNAGDCHLQCSECRLTVPAEEICEQCGRCTDHDDSDDCEAGECGQTCVLVEVGGDEMREGIR